MLLVLVSRDGHQHRRIRESCPSAHEVGLPNQRLVLWNRIIHKWLRTSAQIRFLQHFHLLRLVVLVLHHK